MTMARSPESVQAKFDKLRSEDKESFTGTLICLHLDLMRYPHIDCIVIIS